jgi:1-deoxy-D-xylulose-5-phosphate reductoisomerase
MSIEMPKKRIDIFGSTGSIGTQSLEVIKANPDAFEVEILTAHNNAELLISQALEFNPNAVNIVNQDKYETVKTALAGTDIKVFSGELALEELADFDSYDVMIAAIVGFAGLKPTLKAVEKGKVIALANKETLVVAGDIVMQKALENKAPIIPVDSEHSAIFQSLPENAALWSEQIDKIILTASGEPTNQTWLSPCISIFSYSVKTSL